MNQKFNNSFMLVLCISLALIACNSKDKKTEEATTDTTGTTKTETTQLAADATLDAVAASPNLYKVLKDTMGIKVLEATYKPGDSSAMHSHNDYVVYAVEGGTGTFYAKDGTKMESPMKTGGILTRPAEVHSVKNTGKTTLRVILVEVNRSTQPGTWDAALDATKASPGLYKTFSDTLGLRAIEVNYKPGQSSAMHAHPDLALYVTQGSTAEFTAKDGSKRTVVMDKGMVIISPADAHSVKNIGKTTMKGILVEVNRAMK